MQVLKSMKNSSVPSPGSTQREETLSKVPSENKNISDTSSFRFDKAGDQPGVSRLSTVAIRMSGCQNPLQAPFQKTSADLVHDERQRYRDSLMYSAPHLTREIAVDILGFLIRFDKAITMDDSRILCDAVNAIHRAEAAS